MENTGHLVDAMKLATTFVTGGGLVAVVTAVLGSKKAKTEIDMTVRKQNFDEMKTVADKHEAAADKCAEEKAKLQNQVEERDAQLAEMRHTLMALEVTLHRRTLRLVDAGLPADDVLTPSLSTPTPHKEN